MSNFGLLTLSGLGAFPLWEAVQIHFTSFGHRSVLLHGTEIIKCAKISGLFSQADKETLCCPPLSQARRFSIMADLKRMGPSVTASTCPYLTITQKAEGP